MKKRVPTDPRKHELVALSIDHIAACPHPAQEGAVATVIKARGPAGQEGRTSVAKRAAITTGEAGHSHRLVLDYGAGELTSGSTDSTSGSSGEGSSMPWHSHPWVMDAAGNVTIGECCGHSHKMGTVSKSADDSSSGDAMPDGSYRIADAAGLELAMKAFESYPDAASGKVEVAKHIVRRARELGVESKLQGSDLVAKAGGQAMQGKSTDTEMTDEEKRKLKKSADTGDALAALTPAEFETFKSLRGAAQDQFLFGDHAVRKSKMDAVAEGLKVLYVSKSTGASFLASDDPRTIDQAKAFDVRFEALAKQEAEASARLLKARAEEFNFFGGDLETRTALLKAVDGIADEALRGKVTQALKARADFIAKAGQMVGIAKSTESASDGSAAAKINAATRDLVAKSGGKLTPEKALSEFLKTQEGRELYAAQRQERDVAIAGK